MDKTKNVLIVDDDDAIVKLFELIGRRMNLKILTSKDGSDAYTKFKNQKFDLVLTDLDLPKISGLDFMKKVRREPNLSNYPFVVITGKLSLFKNELKKMPNLTIIEKPIKINLIQDLFRKHLDACLKEEEIIELNEVEERIQQGFKVSSSILLDFTTKDRPKITKLEKIKSIECNYISHHPVMVGGNRLCFYFLIDKSLAEEIKAQTLKDKEISADNNAIIVTTLKKLLHSFIKKLFDVSGFFYGINKRSHQSLVGTLGSNQTTYIDLSKTTFSYMAENKYGKLKMIVLRE
ncbi:MAG: response regulator [Bacteriovoracaceae bacterium]